MNKDTEITIELPIGYIYDKCDSWEDLCDDLGLSSDCLVYGYYEPEDKIKIDLDMAKRHGILK